LTHDNRSRRSAGVWWWDERLKARITGFSEQYRTQTDAQIGGARRVFTDVDKSGGKSRSSSDFEQQLGQIDPWQPGRNGFAQCNE
jgi:hypothetical protein